MSGHQVAVELAENLAGNLRYLRDRRSMTQQRLAELCGVPRSTLANLETGDGNPTLAVLGQLAAALQISISELLSPPNSMGRVYRRGELPSEMRGGPDKATILKLLPDAIPGMEIDRMEIPAGSRFTGVPHRPGTREYLYCEKGAVVLSAAGDSFELKAGDLCAFQGDQRHGYKNPGRVTAILISVVALAPR